MIAGGWNIKQRGPPLGLPALAGSGEANPPPSLGLVLAPQSRKPGGQQSGALSLSTPVSPRRTLRPRLGPANLHLPLASSSHQPTPHTHTGCGRLTHFLSRLFIGLDASAGFEGGMVVPKETAVNHWFR